jgi:hypothetical protein
MPTYLCRWPNGNLSIAVADDLKDLTQELIKDDAEEAGEWDSADGLIIEMPKGFRLHFAFDDDATMHFAGFPKDAMPTVERLYPHLAAAMQVRYKTKRAALAAAKEAMDKECQGLKR